MSKAKPIAAYRAEQFASPKADYICKCPHCGADLNAHFGGWVFNADGTIRNKQCPECGKWIHFKPSADGKELITTKAIAMNSK
jgi:uncharacterized protein (DUF983 family)